MNGKRIHNIEIHIIYSLIICSYTDADVYSVEDWSSKEFEEIVKQVHSIDQNDSSFLAKMMRLAMQMDKYSCGNILSGNNSFILAGI